MAKLRRKRKRDKVREVAYGRHSPAGYRYLMRKKKEKTPVYFKGINRESDISRLRKAGLTESDLRALGVGKLKRKKR